MTRSIAKVLSSVLLVALVGATEPAIGGMRTRDRESMYQLTNEDRTDRGIRRLELHRRMSELAREHSFAMARRGDLFHTKDPAGTYLRGRNWRYWGENVGVGGTLASLQTAFMSSAPHRENILNRRFADVAVGVARVDGRVWVTVFFYG
jgi:uncharacterized protein YkwD